MPEETSSPQVSIATQRKRSTTALGLISLALICSAAGFFTWSYLSDSTRHAADAIASEAPPPPPPLADPHAFDALTLIGKSAIVVDETTGRTLYEQNADAQWPLASLTKVPLTLAVSETLLPDTIITIPFNTGYNSHTVGELQQGEHWKLQDVIDFTLIASSNEGADILAQVANNAIHARYSASPVEGATLWRMNDLAKQLGLTHTYFLNNNGLDESATQAGAYGSARDIAALFAYAASTTPQTFAATTKRSMQLTSIDGVKTEAINTDEALPALSGLVLGKTGYTDLAGGNLAVVFDINGHRMSAVILGSTYDGRFEDMKKLAAATRQALEGKQQ